MLVIITKINISAVYYSIFNCLESNFLFFALIQRFRISERKSKRERSIVW